MTRMLVNTVAVFLLVFRGFGANTNLENPASKQSLPATGILSLLPKAHPPVTGKDVTACTMPPTRQTSESQSETLFGQVTFPTHNRALKSIVLPVTPGTRQGPRRERDKGEPRSSRKGMEGKEDLRLLVVLEVPRRPSREECHMLRLTKASSRAGRFRRERPLLRLSRRRGESCEKDGAEGFPRQESP